MSHYILLTIGALTGLVARRLTELLIEERAGAIDAAAIRAKSPSGWCWMAISGLGWYLLSLALSGGSGGALTFSLAVFELVLCLSAVDYAIKKIPNELLLALIIVFLASRVEQGGFAAMRSNLIGAAVASLVFLIPSRLGMSIGWGDIKYAFVVGLMLGLMDFVQVMLVMAAALGAYALYLAATKKGTLKTAAAMGPYISLGVVTTMAFPLLGNFVRNIQ